MSIAVVDEHRFTRECIAKSLQEADDALLVAAFDGCESCLCSAATYDLILFRAHADRRRQKRGGDRSGAPFDKLLSAAPVVVLSDVESPDAILEAFENGARGYITTTDTSLGLALEIVRLVRAGGTFVPPSSLALRPPSRREPPPAEPRADRFTPRQRAVLRHLKLGKANKTIARDLEVSESTVKIHLRNIMRKMNAANRTEVVCRAHALDSQQRHRVSGVD
jgi:DNA-binding NarL/FixJ family response regulator